MINQFDRPGRETLRTCTLMITNPKEFNEGEYVCEAMTPLGNDSDAIIFNLSIPDPPSRLIVHQNQTTSSTLFVAWQPGFNGGFNQTFNLEYCSNDTAAMEEECGVITNLTQQFFTLDGLKAFTWYRLTLWAENSAGNSSTVTAMASTAPQQPENYGVTITWVEKGQVLQIPKENQSLDEVCFVLKTFKESCPLQNETKCIDPEKEISIDPDDDVVVVTYGRGLCSEPANITDQPGPTVPSSDQGTPYMIIAIGVIASISVIIVISLGLMYFYGLMCCTKRKKDNGDQPEGRTVDEDGLVYISVAHDRTHPPNAPPIQTEEPTIYASLNKDATKHRKGEMEYSDTNATTPDGQPMYGNYLVKQRKQEQARMPPPVQADDASYRADGSRRSEGAIGPTMPDGQPMYGNYLVKMRKEQERAEQERAEQMAGTYNFFEMYSI
ncbi:protein turtle homolog B-like isoform X2 [Lytechinus variegatus]|uniref:protein turtle homolog B-like isoform X2 n=1 Tax=Lytechinus variegatus TaxID=7654 RepID=UPI001BB28D00|nr:protein turtle homolog B-like isoform X2 [Lytechinus variegatus]